MSKQGRPRLWTLRPSDRRPSAAAIRKDPMLRVFVDRPVTNREGARFFALGVLPCTLLCMLGATFGPLLCFALVVWLRDRLDPYSESSFWFVAMGAALIGPPLLGATACILAITRLERRNMRRLLRSRGVFICAKCRYDVTGLTTDRCPECGNRLL